MEIVLGYDELRAAAAEAEAVLGELTQACDRGEAEVARLLDGGWTGAAATAFADAWGDWLAGAASVRAGLAGLAAGVDTSAHVAGAADATVTTGLARLEERLS
ncbi:hypothetical protein GCM10009623_26900 [Nocardioides aestuarii]|uniref:ESAT-6-like protein n=1 Tax=Nocardioides aestuarii TaxID=252231 RepID=A0ABW4TQR8_9ACTN